MPMFSLQRQPSKSPAALVSEADRLMSEGKYAEAFKNYRDAATRGNIHAMYCVGRAYLQGIGVTQNNVSAFQWYQRAANSGEELAYAQTGVFYFEGVVIRKDNNRALEWYRKAYDAEDMIAAHHMGTLYHSLGQLQEAFNWARTAQDAGIDAAALLDAIRSDAAAQGLALEGDRKTPEEMTGEECFNYALELANNGQEAEAFPYVLAGAEKGDIDCMSCVGAFYSNGTGTEKNEELAFRWYLKAAEAGDSESYYTVACRYASAQNYDQAIFWLKKDITVNNSAKGMYALCNIYTLMADDTQNFAFIQSAYGWGLLAVQSGAEDSAGTLSSLESTAAKLGLLLMKQLPDPADPASYPDTQNQPAAADPSALSGELCCQYAVQLRERGDYQEALRYLLAASEKDYPAAFFLIAFAYENGEGIDANEETAFQWYLKAAEASYSGAYAKVGISYFTGSVVDLDYDKAFFWFKKDIVENGSALSMFALSNLYSLSSQNLEDPAFLPVAYSWLLLAQDKAEGADIDVSELSELADMIREDADAAGIQLTDRRADPQNPACFPDILTRISDEDAQGAEINLGYTPDAAPAQPVRDEFAGLSGEDCYKKAREYDEAKNFTEAFRWYMAAVDRGHKFSMFCVGYDYRNGEGVEKDDAKAFQWYQRAADEGVENAYFYTGYCYGTGTGTVEDKEQAVYWYKMSALHKNESVAMKNLAVIYRDLGELQPAYEWALLAQEKGANGADNVVGELEKRAKEHHVTLISRKADVNQVGPAPAREYPDMSGEDCYKKAREYDEAKNFSEAFQWYLRSARKGHAFSMYCVAYDYKNGEGVEKDEAKAFPWYLKAAECGIKAAYFRTGVCYDRGYGCTADKVKAIYWFRQSARAEEEKVAMKNVSILYRDMNLLQDAYEWALLAKDKGADAASLISEIESKAAAKGIRLVKRLADPTKPDNPALDSAASSAPAPRPAPAPAPTPAPTPAPSPAPAPAPTPTPAPSDTPPKEFYEKGKKLAESGRKAEAFNCYLSAAKLWHRESCYLVAAAYDSGDGVAKDPAKAGPWYIQAADAGDTRAFFSAGYSYTMGLGVERDLQKAIYWFTGAAAEADSLTAIKNVSAIYMNLGEWQKAYEWALLAQSEGVDNMQGIINKIRDGARKAGVSLVNQKAQL